MSGEQIAVSVQDLTYSVRGDGRPVTLLAGVSFSLTTREIVALVGPNGAGKTTLIRLLAGLSRPTSGGVLLDGMAVHKMAAAERARRIAYVGQSDEVDGRLSVAQYVGLGRLPHDTLFGADTGKSHALRALEAVKLSHLAPRRMDRLSGGERQKAKIARALCQEPSVLILDEPTNHLDPSARGELLSAVSALGIPVIVALHDLTLIDAFAHKVAIIDSGRLCAFGTPQDALSAHQVRSVFDVDLHRFAHPAEARTVPALDIAISSDRRPQSSELLA